MSDDRHSIRVFLRRGHQLDLRMQKVPEGNCCVLIDADTSGDYRVTIGWTVVGGGEPVHAESEVDDLINHPSAGKNIGECHGNIVGIQDQTCPDLNYLIRHQQTLQSEQTNETLRQLRQGVQP